MASEDESTMPVSIQESAGTVEAPWSAGRSMRVGGPGAELYLPAEVQVLSVESITAAVSLLNAGDIACPQGFCVCWSVRARSYFVLYATGKLEAVHGLLSGAHGPSRSFQPSSPLRTFGTDAVPDVTVSGAEFETTRLDPAPDAPDAWSPPRVSFEPLLDPPRTSFGASPRASFGSPRPSLGQPIRSYDSAPVSQRTSLRRYSFGSSHSLATIRQCSGFVPGQRTRIALVMLFFVALIVFCAVYRRQCRDHTGQHCEGHPTAAPTTAPT